MTDFRELLRALADGGVEFLIVGGAAAAAHGASRLTEDLDIVYRRTPDNIRKLSLALSPLSPYPRGAARSSLSMGCGDSITRFEFHSDNDCRRLGSARRNHWWRRLRSPVPHTVLLHLFEMPCACLTLKRLIEVKKAAGRPKDLEAIAELEAIRDELGE